MNSTAVKTVALIDPLWIGHHPMYFSQFTASFLRSGANVIGLCPEPEAALRDLKTVLGEDAAHSFTKRVCFHQLPAGKRSFFNGRFEGDPLRTFQRWRVATAKLADAEVLCGMKADLVYFPYLDSYMRFLPFATLPQFILNRPWSGLYLRNHHHGEKTSLVKFLRMFAKGDDILRSRLCPEVGVLDERFIPAMEKAYGKPITAYPDVTQVNLPEQASSLSLRVNEKAAERTIIGIIGLERRKGFLTLLQTAEIARKRGLPYFFVAAGILPWADFSIPEQAEFHDLVAKIASGEVDNVYFDPAAGRISDEADYNSLFSSFDIAWASYEGFQGSSGTLSKAAAFEIPCIASRGECVGLRVEKYHIGLNITAGNAEEALAVISCLIAGTDRDGKPLTPDFAAYREHHSVGQLDRILAGLLASI